MLLKAFPLFFSEAGASRLGVVSLWAGARKEAPAHSDALPETASRQPHPSSTARASDAVERDHALLQRMRHDDPDALAEVIDHYANTLHRLAYVMIQDSDIAADIVQDVFVSIWERRQTLTIRAALTEFLYGAVRNGALRALRKQRSQTRVHHIVETQYVIMPPVVGAADEAVVTQEFTAAIAAAIESLTPRVRETFLLSRMQQMSSREIAEALQVSVATVESQISRAVKQILSYLAPFR